MAESTVDYDRTSSAPGGPAEPSGETRSRPSTVAAVIWATALFVAALATTVGPAPASAASGNLCERGHFERIYRNTFGGRENLNGWTLYDRSPGHAGNGRRSASAVKKFEGKLVITATRQNGQTVSGGLSHRGLSQRYGCYRFRVRTDHD